MAVAHPMPFRAPAVWGWRFLGGEKRVAGDSGEIAADGLRWSENLGKTAGGNLSNVYNCNIPALPCTLPYRAILSPWDLAR